MDGVHRSWEAQRGIPRLAERWIGVSGPIASSGLRSVCLKRRGRFPEKETAPVNARDSVDDQGGMLETGGTMQRPSQWPGVTLVDGRAKCRQIAARTSVALESVTGRAHRIRVIPIYPEPLSPFEAPKATTDLITSVAGSAHTLSNPSSPASRTQRR